MIQNLIRIPDNMKISMNSSSLLNSIYSFFIFFIYLIFIISFCNVISFGVNAQQIDSDGTITIPFMQWEDLKPKLSGTPPPGLKDFAFGYSKDSNMAVIFGGTTPSGTKSGATYLIDFADYKWKSPTDFGLQSPQPEPRSNMIYGVDKSSSYRNAFIISCGAGSGDVLYNDIWAFDFTYKIWTKIDNVTGESPPPLMNSFGGIDVTLATSSQTVRSNTLWASHGTNGSHFFTDLYALLIDGTFSPNLNSLTAVWYKVPVSGDVPPGRSGVGGTILSKRLAMYGGCDKVGGNCATSDSYSLDLGSSYTNGIVSSAQPLWSKKNSCLGARFGAAMTMNSNPNQAIVFGGSSPDLKPVGADGEIGVLDTDVGNWVRVLPQRDPVSGYPHQSTGAQMVPIPATVGEPKATSILLFGGELLDGTNSNLNDIWVLYLNNNLTSGNTIKSNPQITSMEFLKCVQEPKQPNSPAKQPSDAGNEGVSPGDVNSNFEKFPSSHVTSSTISIACLPLAASVIRFGYGSNKKWAIAGLYTLFIVASYATAFYGFAIAFQNKQKFGHFNTLHGKLGIILLTILYIIVPSLAIISLYISKKYDSDLNLNNDSDNDKGGSKLGFLNWRNSESNSKPIKSFEVSRPGNRLLPEGETPSQSFPTSVLKSSDNWMEKRKSVTIAENHPTMSSQGSRNNSLQNGPSSRRTSQSTAVSRSGLQPPTTPSSNHSSSTVVITRHIHHVVAQSILLLTIIYIGIYIIERKIVDSLSFYIFVGFMAIIYLIWIIAAWYGHPKGRNSLLVLFMHKIACGKGEKTNEMKQYDYEDSYGSGGNDAMSTPSTNRRLRIEDDDMDEEAEQAQLEQDMHNREVVVMTIPKRRLTVVNA